MNKNKNLRLLSMKIIHTKYMQHQKNADLDIYLLLAIKSGSIMDNNKNRDKCK